MRFQMVPKSSTLDDRERPWTAKTHSVTEKMRLLEPTAQIWMKIDPYHHREKFRPMTLVSGNIRCMRTFAGAVCISFSHPATLFNKLELSWVELSSCRRGPQMRLGLSTTAISLRCGWLLLRKRQIYGQQYYMAIRYPLSACDWLQNEWPRMTLIGYIM